MEPEEFISKKNKTYSIEMNGKKQGQPKQNYKIILIRIMLVFQVMVYCIVPTNKD